MLRLAKAGICNAMRLVPRRRRCGLALALARAAEPFLRLTKAYRQQSTTRVASALDVATHLVLHALTRHGVEFDPGFDFAGYDDFLRAFRKGRGIMLVAPHTGLGLLILRRFYDDGIPSVTISSDELPVLGTRASAPVLLSSPTFLVATRNRLRRGEIVGAMLDRGEHHDGRTFEFETANGPVILAPALLQVAARCGAHVVFIEAHAERRGLAGTLVVASSDTAEGLTREFIEFVRTHVETHVTAAGDRAPGQLERAEAS